MEFSKLKWSNLVTTSKVYIQNGFTAHKISFSVSAGLVLGIIPLPGTTIVLCIITAFLFRLNHVLIQTVNMLVYPLQLLLLLPFYRIGSLFFMNDYPAAGTFRFSYFSLQNIWQIFGRSTASALLLWIIISIPIGFLTYLLLKKSLLLKRVE